MSDLRSQELVPKLGSYLAKICCPCVERFSQFLLMPFRKWSFFGIFSIFVVKNIQSTVKIESKGGLLLINFNAPNPNLVFKFEYCQGLTLFLPIFSDFQGFFHKKSQKLPETLMLTFFNHQIRIHQPKLTTRMIRLDIFIKLQST